MPDSVRRFRFGFSPNLCLANVELDRQCRPALLGLREYPHRPHVRRPRQALRRYVHARRGEHGDGLHRWAAGHNGRRLFRVETVAPGKAVPSPYYRHRGVDDRPVHCDRRQCMGMKLQREIKDVDLYVDVRPDTRFIRIIRDGGDVLASRLHTVPGWGHKDIEVAERDLSEIIAFAWHCAPIDGYIESPL